MLNNILLILKRMVEHNAVIYVYCDFNLKLLRPTSLRRCSGMHAMWCCVMVCADSNNKIDESIRYQDEN